MLKRFTPAFLVAMALGATLVACGGDRSVLVGPLPGDVGSLIGFVPGPDGAQIRPVVREAALKGDVSWSFDAGPDGVAVRHPMTGLAISIPPGALAAPARITITALRGAPLAYRFEPHGLQFNLPVELTQSFRGLKVQRDAFGFPRLVGGYFPEDSLKVDAATGLAQVVEVLPVWLDEKGRTLRLEIRHFSGYTVASAMQESIEGNQ